MVKIEQTENWDRVENWTKLKIGQNWKLDKIERLDKIESWTKLKVGQNWKIGQITIFEEELENVFWIFGQIKLFGCSVYSKST